MREKFIGEADPMTLIDDALRSEYERGLKDAKLIEMAKEEEEAGGFPGVTGALVARSKRKKNVK